jgi:hypothetical protein
LTLAVNMVFNLRMSDSELIDLLGGPTRLAERLGYEKAGGVQRVQNWKVRGIPSRVKLEHPDLFLSLRAPAVEVAEAGHVG